MKEINKLVTLVTHGLKSSYGVIDLSGKSPDPGKEQQLYNGVLDGSYPNDEVTAKGMYDANIYDQRFRMLKSRLRYKLYDLLYYYDFDIPKYSYAAKKRLECKEYLHKARILFEMGENAMAEKQFNKVLVIAEECQFTKELIEANELKRTVLAVEHKPTDFELTLTELHKLRERSSVETSAEDLFLKVEMMLTKSIHSRNTNYELVCDAVTKLEEMYARHTSFNIFEMIYLLKIWQYNLSNSLEELIKLVKSAPTSVEEMDIDPLRFDVNWNNYVLARTYLLLEKYEEGLSMISDGYVSLDKSTEAWFLYSETHFLLAIRAKKYVEALEVLTVAMKNPSFNRLSDVIVNRWKYFKLYLNFAYPEKQIQKRIRFFDFYESKDNYYRENKGYLMSLYLLDFIHQLGKQQTETAESKLDDLESFFYKHLNEPGKNQREKQLLKMIKSLRSSNFDVETTQEKVTTYRQRLEEKKVLNPFADVEIISYEELWEMMLSKVSEMATVTN